MVTGVRTKWRRVYGPHCWPSTMTKRPLLASLMLMSRLVTGIADGVFPLRC